MSLPALLRPFSIAAARQRGTGLPRLSAWLLRHFQKRGGVEEISDFQGNVRLAVDLRDHMGGRIFWFDSYSTTELKLLRSLLAPGDIFIDAGANIGEFTLVAAQVVGSTGKVVSIEPMPAIRSKLEKHVAWNDFADIVTIIPFAVGEREGSVSMYAPPAGAGEMHEGLPTIFASAERSDKVADVAMTTIDKLAADLPAVTGMKLDIEGAEPQALRGAIETLKRHRPWLIIEMGSDTRLEGYDPAEIFDLLLGLDYAFARIEENGALTPLHGPADLRPWQNVLVRHQPMPTGDLQPRLDGVDQGNR